MDKDEQRHLEKLHKVLTRRLRVLELQAARLGGNTPPDVVLEMEDLHERITEVEAKLSSTEPPSVDVKRGASSERVLQIVLNIDYTEWNPTLQDAALRAFAAVMDVSPDRIKIMDVQPGSVNIVLSVPGDAADRLLELYKSGHPVIHDLYIERLEALPQSPDTGSATPQAPSRITLVGRLVRAIKSRFATGGGGDGGGGSTRQTVIRDEAVSAKKNRDFTIGSREDSVIGPGKMDRLFRPGATPLLRERLRDQALAAEDDLVTGPKEMGRPHSQPAISEKSGYILTPLPELISEEPPEQPSPSTPSGSVSEQSKEDEKKKTESTKASNELAGKHREPS
jgi:hypothetical protein